LKLQQKQKRLTDTEPELAVKIRKAAVEAAAAAAAAQQFKKTSVSSIIERQTSYEWRRS
jgi:hypothetical protein